MPEGRKTCPRCSSWIPSGRLTCPACGAIYSVEIRPDPRRVGIRPEDEVTPWHVAREFSLPVGLVFLVGGLIATVVLLSLPTRWDLVLFWLTGGSAVLGASIVGAALTRRREKRAKREGRSGKRA